VREAPLKTLAVTRAPPRGTPRAAARLTAPVAAPRSPLCDQPLEAPGPASPPASPPPLVVLDGANLMWGYGLALARRFGCKAYPSAAGLLLALDYEPWRAAGVRVTALLPASYAAGELAGLADGCGGDVDAVAPGALERGRDGCWRNVALCAAAAAGRVQLVHRTPGEHGRGDDDRQLIRLSRAEAAFVCSNDLFREHFKLRGGADAPSAESGGRGGGGGGGAGAGAAHMFRNRKRFGEWARERRFGFNFAVAPGMDDALLLSVAAAAAGREPSGSAAALAALRAAPWREPSLPVFFQPQPGTTMLAARAAMRERDARERRAAPAAAVTPDGASR
jgi:hypothetical protein